MFFTDEVETHALADIHLEVDRGDYLSIAGPSGCGKTTLLSLLGLLDTPTDGKYWLNGRETAGLTAAERARVRNREVGFIFQAFNLIGDLTVFENVELPLTYHAACPAAAQAERGRSAREGGDSHRFGTNRRSSPAAQQQRVAGARAVVRQAVDPARRRSTGTSTARTPRR